MPLPLPSQWERRVGWPGRGGGGAERKSTRSLTWRGGRRLQAARLDTLDLSWNKLGTQAGRALGAGLFYTRSLTSLNLGYNSLQNGGTAAIAEALRFHPACPLRTLNLSAARMQSEVPTTTTHHPGLSPLASICLVALCSSFHNVQGKHCIAKP